MLNKVEFKDLNEAVSVQKMKVVACDGRGLSRTVCVLSQYNELTIFLGHRGLVIINVFIPVL